MRRESTADVTDRGSVVVMLTAMLSHLLLSALMRELLQWSLRCRRHLSLIIQWINCALFLSSNIQPSGGCETGLLPRFSSCRYCTTSSLHIFDIRVIAGELDNSSPSVSSPCLLPSTHVPSLLPPLCQAPDLCSVHSFSALRSLTTLREVLWSRDINGGCFFKPHFLFCVFFLIFETSNIFEVKYCTCTFWAGSLCASTTSASTLPCVNLQMKLGLGINTLTHWPRDRTALTNAAWLAADTLLDNWAVFDLQ